MSRLGQGSAGWVSGHQGTLLLPSSGEASKVAGLALEGLDRTCLDQGSVSRGQAGE